MKKGVLLAGLVGLAAFFAPTVKGGAILVGQCIESTTCYSSSTPTPWSSILTLPQLTSFGLGSTVPLVAAETSQFDMQLGITTIVFTTGTGPVTETLPQFTGLSGHTDPCNFCEIDTVGTFAIPANATGATISGFFGNTTTPTSAGMNVCLGSGSPCGPSGVPEPGTFGLVGLALAGSLGAIRLRRT